MGIVRSYNDEQDNAIDVEFHDSAVHHAMHLTNTLEHSIADLSQEAVLLACEGTEELARCPQGYRMLRCFYLPVNTMLFTSLYKTMC